MSEALPPSARVSFQQWMESEGALQLLADAEGEEEIPEYDDECHVAAPPPQQQQP